MALIPLHSPLHAQPLRLLLGLVTSLIVSLGPNPVVHAATSPQAIRLQLKWYHQFQFAGYYAAQAKGYYKDEGLEVTILEGGNNKPPLETVLNGAAAYGVSDADIVLAHMKGQPIVALAAIFQHSPYILLSRKDRHIRTPADLAGAKVMLSGDQGAAQVRAMLIQEGVDPARLNILPHSWNLDDLIEGRVDAVSAYAMVEPAQMRARGVEPAMLRSIDYGVDFYGDTLFTTTAEINAHPQRVLAFKRASLKGWNYALTHPEEIADLIVQMKGVRERGLTRAILLQEAQDMRPFILPEVVEIGHMNPGRWLRTAQTFASLGMAPLQNTLDDFIYDPDPPPDQPLMQWMIGLSAAGVLLAGLILLWNIQIRRQVRMRTQELQTEIQHRKTVESELRASEQQFHLIFTAAATGIAMTSTEGQFLMVNPVYCDMVGYSEAELRRMNFLDLTAPEDRLDNLTLIEQLISGKINDFVFEKRYVRKDGTTVWVSASVSFIDTHDGEPARVIAVTENITHRKQGEAERERLLKQNLLLLESMGEGMFGLNTEGRCTFINQAAARMLGYDPAEPLGRNMHELIHYRRASGMPYPVEECPIFGAFQHGQPASEQDEVFWRKDGTALPVAYVSYPIMDAGRITGSVVTFSDISARKQAEQRIADELRYNQKLIDASPLAIITYKATGAAVSANAACLRVLGAPDIEAVRAQNFRQIETWQQTGLLAAADKALASNQLQELEVHTVNSFGKAVWLSCRLIPFSYANEPHLLVFFENIQERKRIEGAIREREELYRVMLETTNDGVLMIAADSSIRYANPSIRSIFGHRPEELIGQSIALLQPEHLRSAHHHGMQRYLDTGKRKLNWRATQTSGLHRDGHEFPIEVAFSSVHLGNEQLFVGFIRDATERVRAQEAIRESEERFRYVARATADAIWDWDLKTNALWWNDGMQTLFGFAAEEIEPGIESWTHRIHPEDRERVLHSIHAAIDGAANNWSDEYRFLRKDGSYVYVLDRGFVVRNTEGLAQHMVGGMTDLSERKQAELARASLEAQLRESQKMEAIGTLAGGVAHDFNNILGAILGNTELARQDAGHNAAVLQSLDEIRKAGNRARDLVQQILTFSRRQSTTRQPVDLTQIIEESARLLRAVLPARIGIECHSDDPVPAVMADPTQLQQVLLNLATNAAQAMDEQPGQIEIHVGAVHLDHELSLTRPELRELHEQHPGLYARISVRDTGHGMDAATMRRIFEPFFTTKPVGQGTGLGLAVAHGIMRAHEGAMTVDSTVGQGSRFDLYFPGIEASVIEPKEKEAPMANAGNHQHILYMDDDRLLVDLFKRMLERRGYRVTGYLDPVAGLDALKADPSGFDLVLTDYNMPGLSGLEVARAVRTIRPDLPIAVVSGYITEALEAQAAEAGISALIFKPSAVKDLCDVVHRLLSSGAKSE